MTSVSASLTVNPAAVPPTIASQPVSQSVTAGATITLSVVATTGGGTLSYQWKKGSANVGTNSATLTLNNVTIADAGSYSVVVSNIAGSATSSAATLTVNATAPSPTVLLGKFFDYPLLDFEASVDDYYQAQSGTGAMRSVMEPGYWGFHPAILTRTAASSPIEWRSAIVISAATARALEVLLFSPMTPTMMAI